MNNMQPIDSIIYILGAASFQTHRIKKDEANHGGQHPQQPERPEQPHHPRTSTSPRRKKVFICSPLRGVGDTPAARVEDNERNLLLARQACRFAVFEGYTPKASHLYYPQFLNDDSAVEREIGCLLGLLDLAECDELWVFGNRVSAGMEREIQYAEKNGIPIRLFKVLTTEQRIADVFGADALFREVT